jgi:uncharacterized protein (TIGR02246 family)
MDTEQDAIRALHARWMDALSAQDLASLLSMMTEDVVLLSPGGAPIGRDGFRERFSSAHEALEIHCVSELEEVIVDGAVAIARSRDSLTVRPRDGGSMAAFAGHRLTVYRRQADGRWLLARDAHTLTPISA